MLAHDAIARLQGGSRASTGRDQGAGARPRDAGADGDDTCGEPCAD